MESTGRPGRTGEDSPAHESADWLRATIDLAPIGIAHLALDGRFLFVNDHLCAMLGYAREELLARTFQGVTFPDEVPSIMALNAELAVGKRRAYRQETKFVHPDASTLACRISVAAVPYGATEPAFLVAMIEELPERRGTEEESIAYQAKLLDITHEPVMGFDARHRITFWNRGAERVLGWSAAEVCGKTHEEVFGGASDDEKRQYAERLDALRRGETASGQFTAQHRDGSTRSVAYTARAFFDANGALAGHVAVHRELTDRATEEAPARDVRAQAEHAKRLHDEMLAVVAHNLRGPLKTIALTEAMMEILPPDDEPTRPLAVMQRSALSMERLIRDLLDVTRMEAGTFAVRRERVLIAPLVQQVCEQFASAARECEITLVCDLARGVRAVEGDRERVAQVLSILIANAIKFTPPQGGVSVRTQLRDRHVQISVEDTGPDARAARLPHIFDRFWQSDRASSAAAGLGLQIAKGIVEAHGGHLWAESTPGGGNAFHFTLPARH